MVSQSLVELLSNIIEAMHSFFDEICCRWLGQGVVTCMPYVRMMLGNISEHCVACFGALNSAVTACVEAESMAQAVLSGRQRLPRDVQNLAAWLLSFSGSAAALHNVSSIADLVKLNFDYVSRESQVVHLSGACWATCIEYTTLCKAP